jgi:hypothetical protein
MVFRKWPQALITIKMEKKTRTVGMKWMQLMNRSKMEQVINTSMVSKFKGIQSWLPSRDRINNERY